MHRLDPERRLLGASTQRFTLLMVLLGVGPLAGCSEAFLACYDEWQVCKETCPTEDEVEQAVHDAGVARECCRVRCSGDFDCELRCEITYNEAIRATTACTDRCEEEFVECVEDLDSSVLGRRVALARQVGSGLFEVDRKALTALLASPTLAVQGATLVPRQLEVDVGFALLAVKPDAVIAQLGGQAGDVLTHIDGHPVSASSLHAGIRQLRERGLSHLTVLRAGAARNLTYVLR